MITPGLVSVTFRKLDVASVVSLAAEAGLTSIEWGADVHVPVGDSGAAAVARKLCAEAGLEISSYGSYYRADTDVGEFESVVTTAVALGAPSIRVWAGRVGSDGASLEHAKPWPELLRTRRSSRCSRGQRTAPGCRWPIGTICGGPC